MNNEIGRRDFMKLSAASIMTASVALNFRKYCLCCNSFRES